MGWTILLTIWILAIAGITVNAVWPGRLKKVETVIYVLMGWMCLLRRLNRLLRRRAWHGGGPGLTGN
ncbi:hypothetical protein WP50_23495 [Lactiplantibacillus plantarum]|nr:hypothetical protein WP50_23495 [Lactiplantibacillus plantarum]